MSKNGPAPTTKVSTKFSRSRGARMNIRVHLFTSNNGCLHCRQSLPSGAVRTQAMDRVCGICLISSAASIGARHPQRKCFLRPLNAADRIPFQKFGLNLRGTCRRLKMDRGQCYCVTEVGCLSPVCSATSILSNGVCPATAAAKQMGSLANHMKH